LIGLVSVPGLVLNGVPHFWSGVGTSPARESMLSQLVTFQLLSFATIPSLMVWRKNSPRSIGLPVAISGLAYHTACTLSAIFRLLTDGLPFGPDVSLLPFVLLPFRTAKSKAVALGIAAIVLHGFTAASFAEWILRGSRRGKDSTTKIE
ncbi:hypothetical protein BC831DRAFT_474589, partial [Entophlyctis helioformis]